LRQLGVSYKKIMNVENEPSQLPEDSLTKEQLGEMLKAFKILVEILSPLPQEHRRRVVVAAQVVLTPREEK
jgi:hypothetical protein